MLPQKNSGAPLPQIASNAVPEGLREDTPEDGGAGWKLRLGGSTPR